ncbi:MAG TPA: UDP-N-acetylglucosamine 4,6-dehydratase (inverting) [Alphaproteobacteria bacterium]|nr:UDP-N-acetylglucosamine 4,6-dehydratase (inverting) [Alphaproteobacteria bacterium]
MHDFRTSLPDQLGRIDLSGKSVLVTGGTGSFGQHFVRRLLERDRPQRLVIFSRDELKQSEMAEALRPLDRGTLRFFIGDVRDRDRLQMAMRGVDIVVHAAAMKQVPTAEYNPFECIRTNVMGAENVVNAALAANVERVLALSTDKAVNPANLYGASKLASDKIFVAANNLSGDRGTRFAVVRYGNVIGSRGSVLPLFRRLLAEGAGALPVTHEGMTRFWITLRQGVDFVLSCLPLARGGEIFVPKIPSMRIVDLARALAPAARIDIVGIRPGEKLHEVMITEDDARSTVEYRDRYVIEPSLAFWDKETHRSLGAQPVREGFRYSSETNDQWLDGPAFLRLVGDGA